MSATKEIGYFNSIFIKGENFALTSNIAGQRYYIEEARIKGGFNETPMDPGVRAYAVNDDYTVINRKNAMIYSGIYNSRTGINNKNQFPIGASITKAVDITDGSIQKLHAEDRELFILQEDKCNAAGINKDFIFTAEGSPLRTASNLVIGQVRTFLGEYGISTNPESFAVKGNRKYFTDKKRGVVIRLSRDGITEISNFGMRDYFKDNLRLNTNLIGMYDNVKDQYILHLKDQSKTVGFDESSKGWTSFYTFYPEDGFTLNSTMYTFKKGNIYAHYKNTNYNVFYGQPADESNITSIINTDGSVVKVFKTLGYEGTTGWAVKNIKTDLDDANYTDLGVDIAKYTYNFDNDYILPSMFKKKENKYFSILQNGSIAGQEDEVLFGGEVSGIKGMYLHTTFKTTENTKQELFTTLSEVVISSR